MIRLEKSEVLNRLIRQDGPLELSTPTWEIVHDAIRTKDTEKALKFIDYGFKENKMMHDSMCSFVDDALTYVAKHLGEEEVYKTLRERYKPVISRWLDDTPNTEESLRRGIEFQRGHGGITTVTEETDKYVVKCDPCGSGGQLRRNKAVGLTEGAYPWTWGRRCVAIYCIHCSVM